MQGGQADELLDPQQWLKLKTSLPQLEEFNPVLKEMEVCLVDGSCRTYLTPPPPPPDLVLMVSSRQVARASVVHF